jgi:hypothetical protein
MRARIKYRYDFGQCCCPELQSALDALLAAGLLFRQGVSTQPSYLFKHALIQDAAYSTLLREPRRALHTRIAGSLERGFADIAENQPEVCFALSVMQSNLVMVRGLRVCFLRTATLYVRSIMIGTSGRWAFALGRSSMSERIDKLAAIRQSGQRHVYSPRRPKSSGVPTEDATTPQTILHVQASCQRKGQLAPGLSQCCLAPRGR